MDGAESRDDAFGRDGTGGRVHNRFRDWMAMEISFHRQAKPPAPPTSPND